MRLQELGTDHLHIEAQFWTDSRRTDFMHTASSARLAIVQALTKAGIALPDPDDRRVTIVDPSAGGTGTANLNV